VSFNPLEHKGIPAEDQVRNWGELNVEPLPTRPEDPYTETRVILMNGVEVESILFSHQFSRHTDNPEIKQALALSRRAEQQQEKAVNWLLPGGQTPLEITISYEQVAVDLTAWMARQEPDPYLKQALDFGVLEDFDHLYRYANLYEMINGRHADEITQHLTEIMPGRPTVVEHRHPHDDVRGRYDTHSVDPLSRLHVLTILAAEQQTMNFYMNHGPGFMEPIARGLYAEIAQIEEQHVTHYGSLIDPLDSWIAQWVFHEYNEVYTYWSMLQHETDPRIKQIWDLHLNMELGQLQVACDFLRRYEGREAAELLPASLPDTPITFESNKGYLRDLLATQLDLRTDGPDYVSVDDLPSNHRYFKYQEKVNSDGVPSEDVIRMAREKLGREYRDQTEGDHPVAELQEGARR
jgi:hypothetical protein